MCPKRAPKSGPLRAIYLTWHGRGGGRRVLPVLLLALSAASMLLVGRALFSDALADRPLPPAPTDHPHTPPHFSTPPAATATTRAPASPATAGAAVGRRKEEDPVLEAASLAAVRRMEAEMKILRGEKVRAGGRPTGVEV